MTPHGKWTAYSYYKVPCTGISDFSAELKGIIGQAGALTHVDLSETQIRHLFEMLLKQNPPLIKPIDELDGERRYGIADNSLADYITDCWSIFPLVLYRFKDTWQYRRKPTRDEVNWYVFFYGKKKLKNFFIAAQETRKDSKARMKIRRQALDLIRECDSTIQQEIKKLDKKICQERHEDISFSYACAKRDGMSKVPARITRKEKDLGYRQLIQGFMPSFFS
jgi:hypothetical protein